MSTAGELNGLYQDAALTTLATKRKPQGYLIPFLATTIAVNKMSGVIYRKDPNNADLIVQDTRRAPGAESKTLYSENPVTIPWDIRDNALSDLLPDEMRIMDSAIMDENNKVLKICDNLDLEREVRGKANLIAAATAANSSASHLTTLTSSNSFVVQTVDPIATILAGLDKVTNRVGRNANFVAMDITTARAIVNNAKFQERVKYTMSLDKNNNGAESLAALIGAVLSVQYVKIAEGVVNNIGGKGGTTSLSSIWGGDLVAGVVEAPNLEYGGTMVNLSFNGVISGGEGVTQGVRGGYIVERGREAKRKSDLFVVHNYYADKVVNSDALYIWRGCLAS